MSSAPVAEAVSTRRSVAGFDPVCIATVRAIPEFDCDLYILEEDATAPLLLCGRDHDISDVELAKIEARGISSLYVKASQRDRYEKQLNANLDDLLHNDSMGPEERFDVLQVAITPAVEKAFGLIKVGKAVEQSGRIGQKIVGLLRNNESAPAKIFGVMHHDQGTYVHLVNVSTYCVLLAEALGISGEDELNEIAVGGLLHDIGKRFISKEILNKPGKLSPAEREEVESHPQRGYEDLHGRGDVTHGQLMMVYQHHEWISGGGYPVGITGKDIHPYAQLCAVVDVFDAMTCRRPYRGSMSTCDVLEIMESNAGEHLDKEMVQCWKSQMRKS